MFDFRKKKLNPVVKRIVEDIDDALRIEPGEERMGRLLSIQEDAQKKLNHVVNRDRAASAITSAVAIAGSLTALYFFVLSTACIVALPALVLASCVALKKVLNENAAAGDRQTLNAKINDELVKTAFSAPEAAGKSPRFAQAIKRAFNSADAGQAYTKLTTRVAFVPAPLQPGKIVTR